MHPRLIENRVRKLGQVVLYILDAISPAQSGAVNAWPPKRRESAIRRGVTSRIPRGHDGKQMERSNGVGC